MHIVFGWGLDGLSYPETVCGKDASFAGSVVGPEGMLELLEQRLGLCAPAVAPAVRIAEYLALLKSKDDGAQIYSESLRADSWSTAAFLLKIRDELLLAGWRKQSIDRLPRVKLLSAVEKLGEISAGPAERLLIVVQELEQQTSKRYFDRLEIVGAMHTLPPVWQKILSLLANAGTVVEERQMLPQGRRADLRTLQDQLFAPAAKEINLTGDGSVCIIEAGDEVQCAEVTAAWLANQSEHKNIVLIRGGDCSMLSKLCRRYNLPEIGNPTGVHTGPLLQVLPVAFELAWRPLDPAKIVELLCIQGGPVPRREAGLLLGALSKAPGIGGPEWLNAWKACLEWRRQRMVEKEPDLPEDKLDKLAQEKTADLQEWFVERVPAGVDFMSAVDAVMICQLVEKWAAGRAAFQAETSDYHLAAAQGRMLRELIARFPSTEISRAQLRRMLDAVTAHGITTAHAEAAGWCLLDNPAQIWGQASSVLWWGFAQPVWSAPGAGTWSESELSILRANDVAMESALQSLKRETETWRRAILNATDRLVLVKPAVIAGKNAIPHPLWDEICTFAGSQSIRNITVAASGCFSQANTMVAGTGINSQVRDELVLPGEQRTWSISAGLVPARQKESFSSMDKLLGCSLSWVLDYGAKLRGTIFAQLPEGQQLLGLLAHAVASRVFTPESMCDPGDARRLAVEELDKMIPQYAAELLLPGAGPRLREAQKAIPEAIAHLADLLLRANLTVEGCEKTLAVQLDDSLQLEGIADMICRLPDGRRVILDFKWSTSPGFYRSKLEQGKALQLATYAQLASEPDMRPPAAGYFMLRQARLFFSESGIFPDNTVVRSDERELSDTWSLMLTSYQRELAAACSGQITATGVGEAEPSDNDEEPAEILSEPPCLFCDYQHFCGKITLS